MSLASRLLARWFRLPPRTHAADVERGLRVPMPDGAVLLADRWWPRGEERPPTLLVRTPYGRGGGLGLVYGRLYAERGFQVLVQSCRGTFGSGGEFVPNFNEQRDGLATLAWLREQPWFDGRLGTIGASYLGYVQWALARGAEPELGAMVVQIAPHEFRSTTWPGEAFALDTTLGWSDLVTHQEDSHLAPLLRPLRTERVMERVLRELPLLDVYPRVTGERVPFFEDWLAHGEPGDPWWKPIDYTDVLAQVRAPVHLTGGWYDLFLPHTLAQYAALRAAGRQPHLTVGPWTHGGLFGGMGEVFPDSLAFLRAQLLGERSGLREAPVRVRLMGSGAWREFADWPPPGVRTQRWHLQGGGGLAPQPPGPGADGPDRYRYDPADPTPSIGGTSLGRGSGRRDNRPLEARADVLTYTSAPLERDLDVVGPVRATLWVRSSRPHTDFFARLCDVEPSGASWNVCDGLRRLAPGRPASEADGTRRVEIELWATAQRFRRGHRLRLQVSSGSHPRFARHHGSGEPVATATTLLAADQEVHRDAAHASALDLSVLP